VNGYFRLFQTLIQDSGGIMKELKLSVLLAMLALMLAGVPPALADDCNHLTVTLLQSAIDQGWSVDQDWMKSNHCDHGTVGKYDTTQVVMKATGLYGPKCHIKFNGPKKQYSEVLFNQNYCSSSAGDIKVTVDDGKLPCYQTYKGSYGARKGGKVDVCSFN
jgi:hypothetical protein